MRELLEISRQNISFNRPATSRGNSRKVLHLLTYIWLVFSSFFFRIFFGIGSFFSFHKQFQIWSLKLRCYFCYHPCALCDAPQVHIYCSTPGRPKLAEFWAVFCVKRGFFFSIKERSDSCMSASERFQLSPERELQFAPSFLGFWSTGTNFEKLYHQIIVTLQIISPALRQLFVFKRALPNYTLMAFYISGGEKNRVYRKT